MTDAPWQVVIPPKLYDTVAHLPAPARRAVHDACARLAADPRSGTAEPIEGAEIRRVFTEPTPDGDRISVLYRVHDDTNRVEIIWILAARSPAARAAPGAPG